MLSGFGKDKLLKVQPSLRQKVNDHDNDGNELQTTPEFRAHVAKKLGAMLDSSDYGLPSSYITVLEESSDPARTSMQIADSADDDFRLFSSSVPGDCEKSKPPILARRRRPSSSRWILLQRAPPPLGTVQKREVNVAHWTSWNPASHSPVSSLSLSCKFGKLSFSLQKPAVMHTATKLPPFVFCVLHLYDSRNMLCGDKSHSGPRVAAACYIGDSCTLCSYRCSFLNVVVSLILNKSFRLNVNFYFKNVCICCLSSIQQK
ncbi:protein CUSTOS isoform X5 [Pelodiscus sinensis]|uniref:protein CUSTOS isoform X5 n=1 Tax=Pelodiscus sinensis TaxID=13735 RepID=UPI003F6ABDA7